MKKQSYFVPQTATVLIAPSREMMDPITMPESSGGPGVGDAPARRGVVSYSPTKG